LYEGQLRWFTACPAPRTASAASAAGSPGRSAQPAFIRLVEADQSLDTLVGQ